MEQTPDPGAARPPLSDIELQRARHELDQIQTKLADHFGGLHARYREAMRLLIISGAFTERDLQLMLRGQVLSPQFTDKPCRATAGAEDLADLEVVERRRFWQGRYQGPLDPVPVARHRLHCPLLERGRHGDPLVPCHHAQQANPKAPQGWFKEAPFLPQDLEPHRRAAINFFCDSANEDLLPCQVVQALCQYQLVQQLEAPSGPVYQIRRRPVPPPPAPPQEHSGDLTLRRLLALRQGVLEERARLEAEQEQHRRDLLRYLIQSGRLSGSELGDMTYNVLMVTDEGWLPCRDDPQRTYLAPVEDPEDDDGPVVDPQPQRNYCPLQIRALEGDRAVPCCEAQKIAPQPARMAEVAALKKHREEERRAGGWPEIKREDPPLSWVPKEDASGGPRDIVRLLRIRPCYLLGHTAATYLYEYGQYLAAHPEEDAAYFSSSAEDGDSGPEPPETAP